MLLASSNRDVNAAAVSLSKTPATDSLAFLHTELRLRGGKRGGGGGKHKFRGREQRWKQTKRKEKCRRNADSARGRRSNKSVLQILLSLREFRASVKPYKIPNVLHCLA
jgi:hypothetical protein